MSLSGNYNHHSIHFYTLLLATYKKVSLLNISFTEYAHIRIVWIWGQPNRFNLCVTIKDIWLNLCFHCLLKCPIEVVVLLNGQYSDQMIVLFCYTGTADSTEMHPVHGWRPALPKMNCDCGFLRGLITENNSLLRPCVGYEAEP